ncbi:membrane protein [Arthrobacter phage MaGuCo]|uniref:Membrane protein n=1 Tax=Arthrobacter phage MaGuCo TaxID=3038363 RepID=A0AAF0K0I4_9CAUD|nr:membrane protein [Arthrobacter phage MaGuCo]
MLDDLSLFAWACVAWAAIILAPCWAVAVLDGWIRKRRAARRDRVL